MKSIPEYEAQTLAKNVHTVFFELEENFGSERAWEFVLAYFKGAGSD